MTIVFVETDAAGQVTLTSAEAITFARTQLLPDGGAATSREVSGPPSGSKKGWWSGRSAPSPDRL